MGFVALHAAIARIPRHRVMFVNEWPLEFRVASDTFLFERFLSAHRTLRGMGIVAAAADEPSLRNGMMRGLPELSRFCPVARGAENRFIRFQQFGRGLDCGESIVSNRKRLHGLRVEFVFRVRVNLVAADA